MCNVQLRVDESSAAESGFKFTLVRNVYIFYLGCAYWALLHLDCV